MVSYRERAASAAALRPWVQCVWRLQTAGGHLVLPDGCMDIVWTGSRLIVAGTDTRASTTGVPSAPAQVLGVRFRPGAGAAALGVAAHELRDRRVDLEDLWGAPARELAQRLAAGGPVALLEAAVAARVRPLDPIVVAAAGRIAAGARVAEVARAVALSERQLRRRFHDAVGYGPKTLDRVLRLQRFLEMAGTAGGREGLAALASAAGYADQAHLGADARALTGRTPTELLAR